MPLPSSLIQLPIFLPWLTLEIVIFPPCGCQSPTDRLRTRNHARLPRTYQNSLTK
ncbi:hypothetical protein COCVIDRAFT_84631 [Bipolaris victoriae FI3]|uniref:Uncharacterized protein n=1 Tax=Bipolaris victoriae (strain FI3) TaxID=930091 RepID=W7EQC5_BIPV3|nr:hypothetical protein COCVIDRAFT_84631 [Bipolaris victoriae FI3]